MEITRGDSGNYKFQRKDENGNVITTIADKIYFTVKPNFKVFNATFQKTIDDMTFDNDGTYHFTIDPEDTEKLEYGDYVYDLEVKNGDYKKTISKGIFKITEESTFVNNEV